MATRKRAVAPKATPSLPPAPDGQDGGLPPGVLDAAAVDRAVRRWLDLRTKTRADYCPCTLDALLKDADELADGREDLPEFRDQSTPITVRHFDWLDLLVRRLRACDRRKAVMAAKRKVVDRDTRQAVLDLLDAAKALADRAAACRVPLPALRVRRDTNRPDPALHAAWDMAGRARLLLPRFPQQRYAVQLLTALEDAVQALRTLRGQQFLHTVAALDLDAEQAALKRLVLDSLAYLAPWGRAVAQGDPRKLRRYTLDKALRKRTRKQPLAPVPVPA